MSLTLHHHLILTGGSLCFPHWRIFTRIDAKTDYRLHTSVVPALYNAFVEEEEEADLD